MERQGNCSYSLQVTAEARFDDFYLNGVLKELSLGSFGEAE